jgi:hypothetical protein
MFRLLLHICKDVNYTVFMEFWQERSALYSALPKSTGYKRLVLHQERLPQKL